MKNDKQKYPQNKQKYMDYLYTQKSMELSGIHPQFGIPTSIFPRFPPGISPPSLGVMNQKRLKEQFFNDNTSLNTKLEDFNQMYQKFASGLFEVAYPALPPGHPLYSRSHTSVTLQNENNKLKKENIDLKKQLSNNKKIK